MHYLDKGGKELGHWFSLLYWFPAKLQTAGRFGCSDCSNYFHISVIYRCDVFVCNVTLFLDIFFLSCQSLSTLFSKSPPCLIICLSQLSSFGCLIRRSLSSAFSPSKSWSCYSFLHRSALIQSATSFHPAFTGNMLFL